MLPIPKKCLSYLDINQETNNTRKETLRKELAFCMRNRDKIQRQAKTTYDRITNHININLSHNSCDFKLLEDAYIIYCHDNDLPLSEELQKRYAEITGEQPTEKTAIANHTSVQESKKPQGFTFSVAQLKENAKRVHEQAEKKPTPTKINNKDKGSL